MKMKLSADGKLRLAVRVAFLAGLGAASDGAFAQDAAAAAPAAAPAPGSVQLDTVQVTGSRIRQPNLTASSSMTIVSDKELQLQGTVNVETLLNNMPQTFAEFSSNDSNGATGTATVNLRNLGSARTLVLVDGKRLMPGDPVLTSPDLNFIPAALVDSIEILSGGASAVYGSDALAGVVNFKMKRNFEGVRLDAQGSMTEHNDGHAADVTGIWGANFADGKGNVTLFAGYTNMRSVTQDKRDFSKCSFTTPASGDKHKCQGSRVIPDGRILSYDRYYSATHGPGGDGDYYAIVNPAADRTFIGDDGRTFNFAPFNYLQRPVDRWTAGGFAHDQINEHVDVYAEAMFMDDHTIAQIAPSGIFGQVVTVPCSSPLLSATQQAYLCDTNDDGVNDAPVGTGAAADTATIAVLRRALDVGPRQDDLRHTDYRLVVGARGSLFSNWNYDLSAQRGEVIFSERYLNDVSVSHVQRGLNVSLVGGVPTCASVTDGTDPSCVPVDIFLGGPLNAAATNYIRGVGLKEGSVIEQVVNASVTGDLGQYGLQSPLASSGLGLALGYERRSEALEFAPDQEFISGDLAGQGGPQPAVQGSYNVQEFFTELQAPLAQNQAWAQLLQFDTAYRYSDYTNSAGSVNSYKFGLKWAPVKDATLRASYQRATRAPSVQELFGPQAIGLFAGSDPCSGAAPQFTAAQCANTGVAPVAGAPVPAGAPFAAFHGVYGSVLDCNAGQCNGNFGGNANLKPEVSTTKSVGIIFTPTFVSGLSATVDYFDIEVKAAIAAFPQSTLLICALTGDPGQCGLIHRNGTGRLSGGNTSSIAAASFVNATNVNSAILSTKGIDFEGTYRIGLADMGLPDTGRLTANLVGTYITSYEEGLPGATFDCKGLYGLNCGQPLPSWRHKLRLTWDAPFGLSVSANWRYLGPVTLDKNKNDPQLKVGAPDFIDNNIGAKQYLDLSSAYVLPVTSFKTTLRAGVSNVNGQGPPTVSSNNPNPVSGPPFGNANTYPNFYDSLGRVFFLGVTADF